MSQKLIFSVLVLSLVATAYVAYGSVLGIDLGAEFMKISSISPGKSFVIVEDTASRRKTSTAISFYKNQRWLESEAISKKHRAFASTFTFINKYLGKQYDEQLIQANKQKYLDLYNFQQQEDKGTIKFGVDGFEIRKDEPMSFTVEELVAMFLKHAKFLADQQSGMNIKDAVITIPPSYAMPERYALLDATQIAGLNPLAFIHENTAAALYYSIERRDENKTHTVIFYNLGSNSLKVSLVEFKMENSTEKYEKNKKYESFYVLSEAWDDQVSGYIFDLNIAKWLASEFDNQASRKGKKSITESPAAMAKLITQAKRAKEVLSANKETTVYLESLFEDRDFKTTVTRKKLEELNQAEFQKLTAPIQRVLDLAGKTLGDVDVVEVLGGALRVPKVQQTIQDYLGSSVELGAHMNGDEAMAMGTSFYAASLSASFKTRVVYMNDGLNYPIFATIRNLGDEDVDETEDEATEERFEKNTTLFTIKQRLGSKKALAFTHDKDLKVILYTKDSNGNEQVFSTYRITKVADYAQKRNENTTAPKVSLTFKLNNLGLIDLVKSEISMEETKWVEEVVTKKQKKIIINATEDDNQTSTDTESSEQTASQESAESTTNNEEKTDEEKTEEKVEEKSEEEPERKMKQKNITHTKELKARVVVPSNLKLSDETTKTAIKGLRKIEEFEEERRRRSEAKNRMESFVYKAQELVGDDDFQLFATDEEIDALRSQASDNDDWLYSQEANDAEVSDFEDRYNNMTAITDKVLFRQDQWDKREGVIKAAYKALDDFQKKTNSLNTTKPWIKDSAKNDVYELINKARDWITEKEGILSDLKRNEDPEVSTDTIEARITTVKDRFARVKATPKPKSDKDKSKSKSGSKDPKAEDFLFDMFLKSKNITIGDSDNSVKDMFRNSMKSEYDAWKKEFFDGMNKNKTDEETNGEGSTDQDQASQEEPQTEQKDSDDQPQTDGDDAKEPVNSDL